MRVEGQPAFILHVRAWRESSALVEALSADYGRIALVARGIRGPKQQPQRAALQAFQLVQLDFLMRGEMARLIRVEPMDAAPLLRGDALMAAFYANELLLKLVPRQDPSAQVFTCYARLRHELAATKNLAGTMRLFERDLLEALGFAIDLQCDSRNQVIDPDQYYLVDPESGFSLIAAGQPQAVSGRAIRALQASQTADASTQRDMKSILRQLLDHHLGHKGMSTRRILQDLDAMSLRPRRVED